MINYGIILVKIVENSKLTLNTEVTITAEHSILISKFLKYLKNCTLMFF